MPGALLPVQDLCTRCLKHNKSCARAWELAGSIAEREQAYADAALNYEAAWRLTGRCAAARVRAPLLMGDCVITNFQTIVAANLTASCAPYLHTSRLPLSLHQN